jgi:hypothetical protein
MSTEVTDNKPTYTPEQQAHINSIIDTRMSEVKSTYETKLQELTTKLETLSTRKPEENAGGEGAGKNGAGKSQAAAEQKQLEELLRQAQADALENKRVAEERATALKELQGTNYSIMKNQAIRDAVSELANAENIEFHDLSLVTELIGRGIEQDETSKAWVVKENGIVKKNASLEPMSVQEYLKTFAAQRPFLVKGSTKSGAGSKESSGRVVNGTATVQSKADLKTIKEKNDFINKFGYEVYAELPLKN